MQKKEKKKEKEKKKKTWGKWHFGGIFHMKIFDKIDTVFFYFNVC